MGRHVEVILGRHVGRLQRLAERGQAGFAQFARHVGLVVQPGNAGEVGVVTMHCQPDHGEARAGFRGEGAVVLGIEAQPAVVRHEARMAFDHRPLIGLEVRVEQGLGARRLRVVLVGGAEQGAADLVQVDRQLVGGNAERVLEVVDEGQRVQRRVGAVEHALDAGRVDAPVAQGHRLAVEGVVAVGRVGVDAVAGPAVCIGRALRRRRDDHLVRVFGDGLAHEQAVHLGPDGRFEVADHVARLARGLGLQRGVDGGVKRGVHR
ncbi:hypothetical protein D3C86_1383800 [compost metagenome]